MIQHITVDFHQIADLQTFYRQFSALMALEDGFGNNLDALWDALTGQVTLPLHLTLRHLHQHPQAQQFNALIELLHDAEQETDGAFRVFIPEA